jgi:hypothetical protein
MFKIITPANRENLTSSFFNRVPCISSSYFIALGRNWKMLLNNSREMDPLVSCLTLEEMVSIFPIYYDVGVYYIEIYFFHFQSLWSFYQERMMNLVKGFFFIWWDGIILSLILLICCITLINLWVLNNPAPWNETNLIIVCDLWMCYYIWFVRILLRNFASMFTKWLAYNTLFLLYPCSVVE